MGTQAYIIHAVKKSGVAYFQCRTPGEYPRTVSGPWRVNGAEASACEYEKNWYSAKWPMEEICEWNPPSEKVHRYSLKTEFTPSPTLPVEVLPDGYGCWPSDKWPEGMKQFYEREAYEIPGKWVPITFNLRLIDEDCEPRAPKYAGVKMQLPFNLKYPPVSWHKYPCYIGGDDLYKVIADHIVPRIPKGCQLRSGLSGMNPEKALVIEKEIPVIHEESQSFSREEGRGRSKRVRRWTEPLRKLSVGTVINLGTYDYRQWHPQPPTITGANADDLETKVQEFLDGLIAKMGEPLQVCDKCHGYGITDSNGCHVG